MLDGLYRVSFDTQLGAGFGVAHLVGGKLWGGDSALFYLGTYTSLGSSITADVQTKRHSNIPVPSVLGSDEVSVHLTGNWDGNRANLHGSLGGINFKATLERLAE